jgi:hypothetical protein
MRGSAACALKTSRRSEKFASVRISRSGLSVAAWIFENLATLDLH